MKSHQPCPSHLDSAKYCCMTVRSDSPLITGYETLFVLEGPAVILLLQCLSSQPHDQNLLPLATAELNLKLEHSQGKTIKQPHGSQDSAHQQTSHYHRCYHTQASACHVTMKCGSADAPSPCEVVE